MSDTDDLRALWLRVVASSRGELKRLREEHPELGLGQKVDELSETHWPPARQAAIEDLARAEARGNERVYRAAYRRMDRNLPREYPYAHSGEDSGGDWVDPRLALPARSMKTPATRSGPTSGQPPLLRNPCHEAVREDVNASMQAAGNIGGRSIQPSRDLSG